MRLKELVRFMDLRSEVANKIVKNIEIDVKFLQQCRFMDYSLLLAIKRVDSKESLRDLRGDVFITDTNVNIQSDDENDDFEAL